MIWSQFPIKKDMKVPNEPKVFDQLRIEVLESCPADCPLSFKAGYEFYSKTFFEELTIHSNIFYDLAEGTCTLDLEFLKVDVKQISLQHSIEYYSKGHSEFLKGIDFAESITFEVLIFAWALKPSNKAA